MATFRCKLARLRLARAVSLWPASGGRLVVLLLISLACAPPEAAPEKQEATIQKDRIEHVTPRRDFVGPLPTKLEWTAVDGADSYEIGVENEIEIPVFDQTRITTTSVPWPAGLRIEPGTYYWRIVAFKGGRLIADSGRAAFVVQEQQRVQDHNTPLSFQNQ
jgi:hypothetical protein